MRLLLAYAREVVRPRPYRLADLARAAGMSISARLADSQDDIHQAAKFASHAVRPIEVAVGRLSGRHGPRLAPSGSGVHQSDRAAGRAAQLGLVVRPHLHDNKIRIIRVDHLRHTVGSLPMRTFTSRPVMRRS
jgi:hypothetical protein